MSCNELWFAVPVCVLTSSLISPSAGCISIRSAQRNLSRSVQEDALFSVDVSSTGVPTVQWTFMSGAESRFIGTWQPGGDTNLTADYSSRVKAYENGSMVLLDLRLQDTGFYLLTVTEEAGSSKDVGFVLKVNGETLFSHHQKSHKDFL